jgi:hypothetical protein
MSDTLGVNVITPTKTHKKEKKRKELRNNLFIIQTLTQGRCNNIVS